MVRAADKVIEKAKPIAAHLLEASADDLEFGGGRFSVKGTDQGMAIGEIATAVFAAHNLPDGVEATLDSDATFDPVNFNFPHGTHLCAMEVDTETGGVTMRKYVCLRRHRQHHQPADRRRPGARRPGAGHRAGAVGGGGVRRRRHAGVRLVRGLPGADGGRHDQLRHRPHDDARRPTNTLGTKGVGEAGTIASTPAVVNAVVDAVRHLGVNDIQMPCTPERVWKAINTAGGGGEADRGCGDAALRSSRATARQHRRRRPVIPAQFDYVAPTSVEEALAALAEHGDDAKVLAGGQSLLPVLRMRLNAPEMVIDLGQDRAPARHP